jgi:hypothetical protein
LSDHARTRRVITPPCTAFSNAEVGTALMTCPLQRDLAPDPTRRDSWTLSLGDLELL